MREMNKAVKELKLRIKAEGMEQFRLGMIEINRKCKLKREFEKRIWPTVYHHHNKTQRLVYHVNDPYVAVAFNVKLEGHPRTPGLGVSRRMAEDEHDLEFAKDMALTRAVRQIASTLAGF